MKIKTKKKMNLPQLIEWAAKNKIKNQIFRADKQLMNVQFDEHGDLSTYGFTDIDTTFTVEVEEEITEDTVIPKLLVKFKSPSNYQRFNNDCINGFEVGENHIEAFYILNDDLTMTLIWRDGKLIEE